MPKVSEIFKESCMVTWNRPISDGGSPIIGYIIERHQTTSTRWITMTKEAVKDLFYNNTDLKEDNDYVYRITAVNKAGVGNLSPPSQMFKAKDPWSKSAILFILYL